jgi:hypothetical protein
VAKLSIECEENNESLAASLTRYLAALLNRLNGAEHISILGDPHDACLLTDAGSS